MIMRYVRKAFIAALVLGLHTTNAVAQVKGDDLSLARIITTAGSGSGATYGIAAQVADFTARNQCRANGGFPIGPTAFFVIRQPTPPSNAGPWIVRGTVNCQIP
jgi:hypothetical protein